MNNIPIRSLRKKWSWKNDWREKEEYRDGKEGNEFMSVHGVLLQYQLLPGIHTVTKVF